MDRGVHLRTGGLRALCCTAALAWVPLACSGEGTPRAAPAPSTSTTKAATTSTTSTTSTSVVRSVAGDGPVDWTRSGAWIMRTDRASGTSRPWFRLDRLPELAGLDGYDASVDVSPDGSALAVTAIGNPGPTRPGPGASALYLASTSRPDEARTLDTGLTAVGFARFSPDGRWLAVLGDNTLALVPAGGGAAVRATGSAPLPSPQDAVWSADGRRLTVPNGTNRGEPWTVVFDVDPTTGSATTATQP
jgi:hypothetical protein